jgi:hypothetical protein
VTGSTQSVRTINRARSGRAAYLAAVTRRPASSIEPATRYGPVFAASRADPDILDTRLRLKQEFAVIDRQHVTTQPTGKIPRPVAFLATWIQQCYA